MVRLAVASVVLAALLGGGLGCGGDDDAEAEGSAEPESEAEASGAEASPGEEAGVADAATADVSDLEEIGVPECDDYVDAYMTCISEHIPEELSAEYIEAFKATQEAWLVDAEDEAARETLAETCSQAKAAAEESMQHYECDW